MRMIFNAVCETRRGGYAIMKLPSTRSRERRVPLMETKEQADRAALAAELFSRLSAEDQQKILKEIWELIEKLEAANESGEPEKAE